MERRKFMIGVGSLAAGSAAAMGTGAFSSVTATRDIDVSVADDASAYLRLEGNGSEYVTDSGDGGTLAIALDSTNDNVSGGGEGVNPDAVTQIDALFTIENQGTQPVNVSISKSGDNSDLVEFYPESEAYDGDSLSSAALSLDPGTSSKIYVEADTEGESVGDDDELLDSVTFNANAQ